MAELTDHIDIDAPPHDVWTVLGDVKRLPDFSASTVAVEDAPTRLNASGDSFTQVVKVLGKRWSSRWTVREFERDRLLRTEACVGPGVRIELCQRLEARNDDRTRLELTIRYQLPGGALGRAVSRAGLERRAKRETTSIMKGIRTAAEATARI